MESTFEVRILSPKAEKIITEVNKVSFDLGNDSFEIYPEFTTICTNFNHGNLTLFFPKKEITFEILNGSVNFDNELNSLNIFCLDFNLDKNLLYSFEDITSSLREESHTKFYLQLLENNDIALEK
jgi:hypothetical protein